MAKLSAHGQEIGRVEYLTSAKAYMADGTVLKNAGFGWKAYAKCKAGVSPQQAFEGAKRRAHEFNAARPSYSAYRAALHDLAGLCKRWKLHQCVQMMPDDPDGVWSDACDGYGDNVSADISDVCNLCSLYGAAMLEMTAMKGEPVEA